MDRGNLSRRCAVRKKVFAIVSLEHREQTVWESGRTFDPLTCMPNCIRAGAASKIPGLLYFARAHLVIFL